MLDALEPVTRESLKEICVARLQEWILSGDFPVGKRLPPERDLARQLGVSRPVVHEALVAIAGKGLVSMVPRVGTLVKDYRKEGAIALLTALLQYRGGRLDRGLLDGLLAMRMLFEVETASLAAVHRTDPQLSALRDIVAREAQTDARDVHGQTELDFVFHHGVAMASGNACYPLLLNSFKPIYTNLSGQFFRAPGVAAAVTGMHHELVDAIAAGRAQQAAISMRLLLVHGENRLRAIMAEPVPDSGANAARGIGRKHERKIV